MSVATIYSLDSLSVLVAVVDDQQAPKDLTGATVEADAEISGAVGVVAASATVQNAEAGEIVVSWPAGAFDGLHGAYTCHVRATIGAEVRTVAVFQFTVWQAIA